MKPLLHIELINEDRVNIKISGDPVTICQMMCTAMQARQDIAAAFIASVSIYFKDNNMNPLELHEFVKLG